MAKRKLTVKERMLVRGVVDGKSITQAAKDAGYSPKSAHSIGSETLKKPEVQRAIDAALEKRGLTEDRVAEVIEQGLEAKRVVSARVTNKEADVDTDDFIEVEDHQTRHRFLETLVDIKGLKAPKKVDVRNETIEDLIAAQD